MIQRFIAFMETIAEYLDALIERYLVVKLFSGLLIVAGALTMAIMLIGSQQPITAGEWALNIVIFATIYLAWAVYMVILHRRAKRDEEVQKMIGGE